MKKSLKINRAISKKLQKWIDSNQPIPDAGDDEVVMTYTLHFPSKIEADIKVCNSDNGPWIDAVLFEDGSEVCVLEPGYKILGEYNFEYMGKDYIVVLK